MLRHLAIAVLALVLIDIAFPVSGEPSWTSLRVTYGLNFFSSRVFAKVPRLESKARSKYWNRIPGECSGGKFLGVRYMKSTDPAVIVLYDKNGFVVGLQHGIPKSDVERVDPSFNFERSTAYQLDTINGDEIYLLTAYFIQPSVICHEGRTREEYDEHGTGTDLYLQNGTNPIRDSIHIPMYEEGMNNTRWVKGGCVRSMGVHYWHDTWEGMSCGNHFPFGIIYNRGKVTSFVFTSLGFFDFSERFEHPSESSLSSFFEGPVPQCYKDEYDISGGISSMHVYFSIRPWNIFC